VGTYTSKQLPQQEIALQAVRAALNDLELRVIEFLSEWMVALLMPAKHVLETRSPHLAFMLVKEYWFREFYLGLKVAASLDRNESYQRTIDGQIRCITADFKPKGANVAWNVNYINVFIPAWMVPPMYHSLRRETSKRHDRSMQWVSKLSVPHGLKTKLLPELLPKEPPTRSTLCMDHHQGRCYPFVSSHALQP
jgi:hypothetical protein